MFDFQKLDVVKAIQDSMDYKVIRKDGKIYLFTSLVNFALLTEDPHGMAWEQMAMLVVDGDGDVLKNRWGAITEAAW